jgi:hypothetical protein
MKALGLGLVLAATVATPAKVQAPALTAETYGHWQGLIRPGVDDLRFEEVPWRPSLSQAMREAQAADKPVLLWAMNGHPLGCV